MGYAQAFRLLVAGYKKIKGKMPEGLDLLKIKQEARKKVIEANKVIKVNFDKANNWMKAKPQGLEKLIKKGDVKIGQAPKTTKRKPAVDPKLTQEENIKRIMAENKAAAKRLQEKMNKPEKSLGDKLKDYKGDPDAMREGGLMGYAVGGRIQNLMNTYTMSPSLQNQFADQQDYIDLFDLNTNQFTPTTKSAPASLNTSTPQEILTPNIVKPIIIPGSESEGITSINRSRTNMNQPNAMGGKTPGLKAAAQRSLTGLQTLLDSPFVEFNPLNPMFLFNLAKAGKEKITNQFSNIIAAKKIEEEQEKARLADQLARQMNAVYYDNSGADFTGGRYDGASSRSEYESNPTSFSGSS